MKRAFPESPFAIRRFWQTLKCWRWRLAGHVFAYGDYADWNEAERYSSGYSANGVFEKTRSALRKVRDGFASYERDSVLFEELPEAQMLVEGLRCAASSHRGALSVLDFGGSLGTSYFQCRRHLHDLASMRWSVVEQPHYVRCGREEFQTDILRFHDTLEDALAERPNLVLLSSVISYVPDPCSLLQQVRRLNVPYILIDRQCFLRSQRQRLAIQVVPPRIYRGSYPIWFLPEANLKEALAADYQLIAEQPANDKMLVQGDLAEYRCLFFRHS